MTARRPSVVFLFESIPFQPEDDFPGVVPLLPNLENLAAVYLPNIPPIYFKLRPLDRTMKDGYCLGFIFGEALQAVLNSPLNASGMVQAVFINFGSRGIYEIRPQADFIKDSTPKAFENVLGELFQTGSILRADTVEEVMLRVPDVQTIVARIQEDYVKIGCFSGAGAVDGTNLQEYLSVTSNHQSCFFVFGNFADKEIDHHIEAYVKVSQFNLNANVELCVVLNALRVKWGVL